MAELSKLSEIPDSEWVTATKISSEVKNQSLVQKEILTFLSVYKEINVYTGRILREIMSRRKFGSLTLADNFTQDAHS